MPKHPLFHEEDGATTVIARNGSDVLGAVLRVEGSGGVERQLRGSCTAGKGPDNDLVLDDRTVSRHHATFTLTRDGVVVEDLGSRNGTFFLGSRIGKVVLGLGARVQLGSVTVAIEPDTEALLDGLRFEGNDGYRGMIGTSMRMRSLFALLQRLEGSLATVLIEGESGVGKEEVARVLHEGSPASDARLVAINCGAIAKELVASELFGHRRGAFTGALEARKGAFEAADGGTLFLDEIGELPLDVQPALLRALETGDIRPLGTDETRRVKVRVIAATNRDLDAEVSARTFRQDLFYRLAVVRIDVPPLRTRPDDIELLAQHFAASAGLQPLSRPIVEDLKTRSWPGNARELRNAIQAYAAIGILPQPPPAATSASGTDVAIDPTQPYQEQKDRVVEQFTKDYVRALLRYTNGNQAAAARVGKLDRTYLGRLIAKYGLNVPRG